MSFAFYKRSCRRLPLQPYHGTVRGFNNAASTPKGTVTIRVAIGDRKILLPFLVIDAGLDDLLLGQTTMTALGVDLLNSTKTIRVPGKRAGTFSEVPMLHAAISAAPTAVGRQRKMRAKEDVILPPWHATFLDASIPEVDVQDIFVESLPTSAAVYVLKGVTTAREGTALVNVANFSNTPRHIRRGQALGTYSPTDGTACSALRLDFDSFGDVVAGHEMAMPPSAECCVTEFLGDCSQGEALSANSYHELNVSREQIESQQCHTASMPTWSKVLCTSPIGSMGSSAALHTSTAATYARVTENVPQAEKPKSYTTAEMRVTRPAVNWKDIPADLNVGRGADHVSDEQLTSLTNLLRDMQTKGLFATSKNPGQVSPDIAQHLIDTDTAHPRAYPPRRMAPAKRKLVEEETAKMLASGVIRPSRSPWAAPVVIAAKKDGGIRFCVDYRELNKVTRKDVYPLPRIDDTVDALNGAKFLSAFDMLSGYWQVPLSPGDAQKTAFVTHEGLYEWTCMPFGLTGAPATFQRMMDTVLAGLKWQCCLVYLDDVVVFSRTFDDHLRDLRLIFNRLFEAGLKLKPSKCFFCCTELLYLGYLITPEGLKPDPTTKTAILEYPAPTDVSGVRTFLGMTGHYRQFIPNYAIIAGPIQELVKPTVPWTWGPAQQHAFEQLKNIMTSPPVLKLPDFSRKFKFTLQTDASDQGLGAVLCQEGEDGCLHPVAFASRRLTPPELKYHTQEKEALAIIWACEKFRPYLMGETFDVETDHGSLKWLLGTQKGRLARWAMRLSDFDLTIKPKPGKKNGNADAPSRYPVDDADPDWDPDNAPHYRDLLDLSATEILPASQGYSYLCTGDSTARIEISEITYDNLSSIASFEGLTPLQAQPALLTNTLRARIIAAQRKDQSTNAIIAFLRKEAPLDLQQGAERWYTKAMIDKMRVETDGLLTITTSHYVPGQPLHKRRKCLDRRPRSNDVTQVIPVNRAVIPVIMRSEILTLAHKAPLSGHLGKNKVYNTLLPQFFWKGMSSDVKEFIRSCEVCQRFKKAPRPWLKPLRPITEEEPFGAVAIDLITELPESAGGKFRYIAVFTDMFTKWPEAVPMRTKSAEEVADAFFNTIICRHGVPKRIQTDQGPEFVNNIIARLTDRMGITHVTTTPYNPASNGAAEQFNKTLVAIIRAYCLEYNTMNWDRFLESALWAYRSQKHAATQFSPFELLYGRQPRTPLSILEPVAAEFTKDLKEYNTRHVYELHRAHKCVQAILRDAREAYKEYHDSHQSSKAESAPFVVGDEVMLHSPRLINPSELQSTATKLRPKWNGPFTIVEISQTGDVFTLRDAHRLLRVKIHDIKRYHRAPMAAANPLSVPQRREAQNEPTRPGATQLSSQPNASRSNKRRRNPVVTPVTPPQEKANQRPTVRRGASHASVGRTPPDPPVVTDPNHSYEVDRVLHHTKVRNKYLYMVRWAPPYEDPRFDCYINDRAFERPLHSKVPPALARYWQTIPPDDRPVAYKKLPLDDSALPNPRSPPDSMLPASRKRRRTTKNKKHSG